MWGPSFFPAQLGRVRPAKVEVMASSLDEWKHFSGPPETLALGVMEINSELEDLRTHSQLILHISGWGNLMHPVAQWGDCISIGPQHLACTSLRGLITPRCVSL